MPAGSTTWTAVLTNVKSEVPSGTIVAATWASGVATITAAGGPPGGFSVGESVTISGMTPSGYDGTFTIVSVLSSTQFTYALTTNPGAAAAFGNVTPNAGGVNVLTYTGVDWQFVGTAGTEVAGPHLVLTVTPSGSIAAANWADDVATITTTAALPESLWVGESVTISGMTPSGYDGTFTIVSVLSSSQFTYDLTTNPGTATGFGGVTVITAGQKVTATLSVLDVFNDPVLGYAGPVTLGDSDAPAVAAGDGPPDQESFTAADNGTVSFPVTFLTSGPQTLTAADVSGSTASATVTVNPGTAVQFSVDPPSVQVDTAAPVTVTAYDTYGNVVTGYSGAVTLTTVDGQAASPITNSSPSSPGTYDFSDTFSQAGGQKLVATGGGLAGVGAIVVTPAPYSLSQSTVTAGPTVVAAGGQVAVTLTARDAERDQETSGGLTVAFQPGPGNTTGWNAVGPVVDNGDGTYTEVFAIALVPGLSVFTATIGGTPVTSSPASVTVIKATPTITWATPTDITFGTAPWQRPSSTGLHPQPVRSATRRWPVRSLARATARRSP